MPAAPLVPAAAPSPGGFGAALPGPPTPGFGFGAAASGGAFGAGRLLEGDCLALQAPHRLVPAQVECAPGCLTLFSC